MSQELLNTHCFLNNDHVWMTFLPGFKWHAAAVQFKTIPENVRLQMANLDYSLVEQRCPQKMAIGKLMKEAVDTFHI
jgi:hypothetical protein